MSQHAHFTLPILVSSSNNISKLLDTLMVFLKEFFEKVEFEKKSTDHNNMHNHTVDNELRNAITQTRHVPLSYGLVLDGRFNNSEKG